MNDDSLGATSCCLCPFKAPDFQGLENHLTRFHSFIFEATDADERGAGMDDGGVALGLVKMEPCFGEDDNQLVNQGIGQFLDLFQPPTDVPEQVQPDLQTRPIDPAGEEDMPGRDCDVARSPQELSNLRAKPNIQQDTEELPNSSCSVAKSSSSRRQTRKLKPSFKLKEEEVTTGRSQVAKIHNDMPTKLVSPERRQVQDRSDGNVAKLPVPDSDSAEAQSEPITKKIGQENRCEVCDETFPRKNSLKKHKKIFHNLFEELRCDICNKAFSYKGYLANHKMKCIGTTADNRKCNFCGRTFSNPGYLTKHHRLVHQEEVDYECDLCHSVLPRGGSLQWHKKRFHQLDLPSAPVKKVQPSGETFAEATSLKKRKNRQEENEDKTGPKCTRPRKEPRKDQECEICDKTFVNSYSLKKHQESRKHTKNTELLRTKLGKREIQAIELSKSSQRLQEFESSKAQLDQGTSEDLKPAATIIEAGLAQVPDIRIEDEKKTFTKVESKESKSQNSHPATNNTDPKILLKSKTDILTKLDDVIKGKDYKCGICSSSFVTEAHLMTHTKEGHEACKSSPGYRNMKRPRQQVDDESESRQGHDDENGEMQKCEVCVKNFASQKTLQRHRRVFHPDEQGEKRIRPTDMKFECDECHKRYSSHDSLQKHQKETHQGLKRAKAQTGQNVKLKVEDRKIVTYHCSDCDKSFTRLDYLTRHSKEVHDGLKRTREKLINGEGRSKCPVCYKTFSRKYNMDMHFEQKCGKQRSGCDQDQENLKEDSKQKEPPKQPKFLEEAVSDVITGQGNEDHSKPGGKSIRKVAPSSGNICTVCSKSFTKSWSLRRHVKNLHNKGAQGAKGA